MSKQDSPFIGVTVFGKMPFEGGRRQIGVDAQGPVWGPPEKKGSLQPSEGEPEKTDGLTVIVQLDGRELARAIVPHLPSAVRNSGL